MNTAAGSLPHLESVEVAAYLDRGLGESDQARVEAHLAECPECRAELVALTRLLRTRERPRRVWLPLAAAAAILTLLVPWTRLVGPKSDVSSTGSLLREPASTTAVAPVLLRPRGTAAGPRFIWSAVPGADRYRITVFTSDGSIAWESQVAETTVTLPDTLPAGGRFFWKVEARVGFQRWVSSDLTEFSVPHRLHR